jgi:hypothetical protein
MRRRFQRQKMRSYFVESCKAHPPKSSSSLYARASMKWLGSADILRDITSFFFAAASLL